MTWNNRITKDKDGYAIREVFYDEQGKVEGWTEEALTGYFETKEDLIADLKLKLKDAKRCKEILNI
jgi:hypothetical protein